MARAQSRDTRLLPAHYRHPAEIPTLIASLGLVITVFLLAEAVMVFFLTIGAVLTLFSSLIVDLPLILLYHLGLIWGLLQLYTHHQALRQAAARVAAGSHPDLHEAAVKVAHRLGMPSTPPLYVMPAGEPNAFAIGVFSQDIFITDSLLALLSPVELESVLAHEMAHIKGRHTILKTLVEYPLQASLVHWTMLIPFWLGNLATRWWSRMAEYSADRAAAIAVGGPEPIARALAKMTNAEAGSEVIGVDDLGRYLSGAAARASAEMALAEMGMSHPLVESRLAALARFAASGKFESCLSLAGLSDAPPRTRLQDPERAGPLPYLVTFLLAGLYLAPPAFFLALILVAAVTGSRAEPPASPAQQTIQPSEPAPSGDQPVVTPPSPEPVQPQPVQPPGPVVKPEPVNVDVEAGMLELARIHKERKEYDKARRALEDLLELNPTNLEGHYLLGWVCALSGDTKTARSEFTAVINLAEPGSKMDNEAQAALARLGS